MGVEIKYSQTYFWLNSWVMANIIQLATQSFCDRFVDYRIDPCRRLYDQMVLASRSGVANIVEGTARHTTSIETELRLIDVARGSTAELQSDYFNFLLRRRAEVWKIGNPSREAIWRTNLDRPSYTNNLLHDAAVHIHAQKSKLDTWIESKDSVIVANAMLILCVKQDKMLHNQLQGLLDQFRVHGGFSENMTIERMEARRNQARADNAPVCPDCGKPMLLKMQRKGVHQGREFWGCSDYPNCRGIRPLYSVENPCR